MKSPNEVKLYIVRATHPEQPNYYGTSRGRKIHLAQKHQKGTMTLCNMKVSSVFKGSLASECKICFENN